MVKTAFWGVANACKESVQGYLGFVVAVVACVVMY